MVVPVEYASRRKGGVPIVPGVVGGSGRYYWTIADALAGESGVYTELTGLVPQAGTTAGVLVGPGTLSAVNDFYKDWWVVNTDSTPSNGLVYRKARVSSYVGATQTLTLDEPWDFVAESTFALINPKRIALLEDQQEDVAIAQSVELNLSGHRIKGKVDITGGAFHWIRGGGFITNGLQMTNAAFLQVEADVSRRDATIYALLLTNGSNLGRCELRRSTLSGQAAARRGFMGWTIIDCDGLGVTDAASDVPWRGVEAPPGVSITVSAVDIAIDSILGGTVFYAEGTGAIGGATAYFSSLSIIRAPKDFTPNSQFKARRFSVLKCVGAGSITTTFTSGSSFGFTFVGFGGGSEDAGFVKPTIPSLIELNDFTGTCTPTFTGRSFLVSLIFANVLGITVSGTVAASGTCTITGGTLFAIGNNITNTVAFIWLGVGLTGAISSSMAVSTECAYLGIVFGVAQTAGAPTISITGSVTTQSGSFNLYLFVAAVSVGSYTHSGTFSAIKMTSYQADLASLVSGGTWLVSSATIRLHLSNNVTGNSVRICRHAGTGGTFTVSGAVTVSGGFISGAFTICAATGAGSTAVFSGSLTAKDMRHTAANNLIEASNATGTVTASGAIQFANCLWDLALVVVAATGTVTAGPSSTIFDNCTFLTTLTDRSGAGALTWTAATLRFRNCHIIGSFAYLGTSFSTLEAFETTFQTDIVGTGTRPTLYRLWKCVIRGIPDPLLPEVINDFHVLPANAALVLGQPVTIQSTPPMEAVACIITSILEGTSLEAAGGGGVPVYIVKSGRIFAAVDATVVAGDNLTLDLVTLTEYIAGAFLPGQNGGRALEAAGATIAGKAYSEMSLR